MLTRKLGSRFPCIMQQSGANALLYVPLDRLQFRSVFLAGLLCWQDLKKEIIFFCFGFLVTHSKGFFGCNLVPCQANLHCVGFPNCAGKSLSTTCARNGSDNYFRLTEFRSGSCVNYVAHHGKLATASQLKYFNICLITIAYQYRNL